MLDAKEDDDSLSLIVESVERSVDKMLLSEPYGVQHDCIELWKSLKPLCTDQFELFNLLVTEDELSLDLDSTRLQRWQQAKPDVAVITGTRHVETGKPHGVVRLTSRNAILESSMRQGLWHGLSREVQAD